MFEALEDAGGRPREIDRFMRLWLGAIVVSVVIAVWMMD